eukprot:TRINITY_DN1929_c0_g1_i2.p1 TRINITY_DN1929_c0_g1~~TRINITY_DN1929_c0_g1_i2.p1  ORF type:complete len:273 (-),score=43.58 TRINITY_DN1929_c0_g1_i2:45-839(-)
MAMNWAQFAVSILTMLLLMCATSEAAATALQSVTISVPYFGSVTLTKNSMIWIGHYGTYLLFGGILEFTNPKPKNTARLNSIKREILTGLCILTMIAFWMTWWMDSVEPQLPYFGYYDTNPYTISDFLLSLFVYMFVFDTWFYWTHRMLHGRWFWKHVHYYHHSFTDPSGFSQDAMHPFETWLQMQGHVIPTFFMPVHPLAHSWFGFLTGVFAICAHDGRAMDLNGHMLHHQYKSCNFGLYWGFWFKFFFFPFFICCLFCSFVG